MRRWAILLLSTGLIAGCAPFPDDPSRPAPGSRVPHPNQDPGAYPADEPLSRQGNPTSYVVFGERYYVMDSAVGYRERGIASWYGPGFHGNLTSNGERYDMNAMTAAHKSLPLPTWVRVTNLSNGRVITVRVNDRGPFHDDRIIDLSRAGAEALDMIGTGTAMVEVEALTGRGGRAQAAGRGAPAAGDEAAVIAAPPPQPSAPPAETLGQPDQLPLGHEPQLWLQLGAFGERDNAEALVARLRSLGVVEVTIDPLERGGVTLHRVRIGPIPDVAVYDRIWQQLRAEGFQGIQLVIE